MSMAMSLPSPDTSCGSHPHLSLVNSTSAPKPIPASNYLSEEERAGFIVASSTRRPSVPHFYPAPAMSSPPSSVASSPDESGILNSGQHPYGSTAISPILTPFQWTSDLRQYIMTDIGPQPSNSQMPTLRSHSHLVRQMSCSKISPVGGGACGSNNSNSGSNSTTGSESGTSTPNGGYSRYSTITDLCTIPQDEVLPPMEVPLERRFAHEEWDDEDE
ncbi:hypothetical protein BC939DRAFT_449401 [Gamsiella multidivaricata]|uniref:uncharacterized protein n=1 Tax=Gamsiella multidivaricata TaxID=101098 RepID=UPI00221EB9B6|nr:uncharacterized protein BC939DRAFT_449401 [Gamsiella multidivaricata]KAI7824849.1 hypothetical protein BC939DRAFT_449401 [Gamsiella multidivaricata]